MITNKKKSDSVNYLHKIQSSNFWLFVVFVIYVQLYPNVFFNFEWLKYVVKYLFIALFFLYTFYYYIENRRLILFTEPILMAVLVVVYAFYDIKDVLDYGYFVLISILLSALFINKFGARDVFLKAYIYTAIVLSLHAFAVFIYFNIGGSLFALYENIPGVGGGALYSPLFGTFNTVEAGNGYRAASFFTEANRFAYFLVPAISTVIYSYFRWKKCVLVILLGALMLTQSVAAILTLIFVNIVYIRSIKYKILLSFSLVVMVLMIVISTINGEGDFNRSTSLAVRLSSFEHLSVTLFEYPNGITSKDNFIIEGKSTNISFIYWSVVGGWIGLIVFLLFVTMFAIRIHQVIKITNGYEKGISIGIMAYLILQVFLGIGMEFLFSAFIALLYSYYFKYYKMRRVIGLNSQDLYMKNIL
jgi:hypothetical protein